MSYDEIPISGSKNRSISSDFAGSIPIDEIPLKGASTYNISSDDIQFKDQNEKPLGGTGAYNFSLEEFPKEEETKEEETGPLSDRLESKSWNSRMKAIEELMNLLKNSPDPPFEEYADKLAKFISDSHVGVQENALEILSVYNTSRPDLIISQSETIVRTLIEKALSSAKQQIKQKSSNFLLDFYALHNNNNTEKFIQGLIGALNNKNIKIQAAAISAVNLLINNFGVKAFSHKPFIDIIEKFASVSNAQVRGEALNFYKETYRWVRELIKSSVEKLKKAQKDELEKAFEDIIDPPIPIRYMAGQEPKIEESKPSSTRAPAPAIDIYDMADAKDVFNKYNERWTESVLAMEKWIDKKNALEELNNDLNYPKLAEKSPIALTTLAKRLFNDSNINVMVQAMRLIGLLAKGQRKYFDSFAKQFFPMMIMKFKDKKPQVIQEAHIGLDNLLYSVSLEQVLDDIKEALEDKTPSVKINASIWLEKIFSTQPNEVVNRIASRIAVIFKKNLDDSALEVRNTSFKVLNTLLIKCPDVINPIIRDLPPAKMKKLEEAGDTKFANSEENEPKPREKSPPPTKAASKPKNQPVPALQRQATNNPSAPSGEEELGTAISAEDAETVISSLIPTEVFTKLKDSAWKEKQSGLQLLQEWASTNIPVASENNEALSRFIKSTVKDWKENNFNVNKAAFELITYLAQNCNITKRSGVIALNSLALDKFSDNKLVESLSTCISALCEDLGPKFVIGQIVKNTSDCNKPKVVSECCIVIGKIIGEFGAHTVNLKEVIEYAKSGLSQTNPIIKKASHSLTIQIYSYIGDKILPFISDIKEATLKVLQEDFSKTEIIKTANYKQIKGSEESKIDPNKMLDASFPRANISQSITPAILKKISDTNWKIRKEGLEAVEASLDQSGMRILPAGLEQLIKAIKERLNDPNKSLVRQSLALVSKLAQAMGNDSKVYSKAIIPNVLSNLSDKNSLLRQEALASIDKWAQEVGPEDIINHSATPLTLDNPELRTELLNWLLAHKENLPKCDLKLLIPGIISCLQDRSASIRNATELLFAEVINYIGMEAFQPCLKDLKPAVMNSLCLILDKYRTTPAVVISEAPQIEPQANSKASKASKANSRPTRLKLNPKPAEAEPPKSPSRGDLIPSQDFSVLSSGNKEKRLEQDLKNKWTVDDLREEFVEKLREQIKNNFSADLFSLMFSSEFKKQIEACQYISNLVNTQPKEMVELVDLIFKYIWVRLFETTNTQLYKSILELSIQIVSMLQVEGFVLSDGEASLFLPILCEKSGHNNAVFRTMTRSIIHNVAKIYPPEKVFLSVLQGLNSKNTRSKVECLDELSSLIQEYGTNIAQPRDIRAIAKFVNSPDNNVRLSAVGTIGEVYKYTRDKVWNLIGDIPDKVRDLLEQRFKVISGTSLNNSKYRKNEEENNNFKPNSPNITIKPEEIVFPNFTQNNDVQVFIETEEVGEEAKIEEKIIPRQKVVEKIENKAEIVKAKVIEEETAPEPEILTELDNHIQTLKHGDMSSRVDSLVAINDYMINEQESHMVELQYKANILTEALCKVMVSTFERPVETIPLRFAKYFLSVVIKMCCTKPIMIRLSDNSLYQLSEQILKRLLIDDLDKIGEKGEGEAMLKTLNGAMLRILENGKPTQVFVVLIKLLTRYINDDLCPKIPGLIIRCLLKLTKVLGNIVQNIQVEELLLAMHEYLITHRSTSGASPASDEMGTKTIKTIINELVKLKGENIWQSYEAVRKHPEPDNNIERWINMILSSSNKPLVAQSPRQNKMFNDPILSSILSRLNDPSAYPQAIKEFFDFTEKDSKTDFSALLSQLPKTLSNQIAEDLRALREEGKAEKSEHAPPSESYNFQDFQNRLALMKQRYGLSNNQPVQTSTTLTDLKAKVNTLLSKSGSSEDQSVSINDVKERIKNLNRK
ncbi:unnamed protein product [Blepharisma stoltei]|uniref:TOG domain-containing protein n=1 Tax=Blepharisma stoltei TaxID=1481888 RepID=A0AAU9K4C8_9CILI|nr:unnamed protein product [Blepharisma stoltei]